MTRQAEKEYLRRSGAAPWERAKPFAPRSEVALSEGLHLIQEFGACVGLLDAAPDHRILDLGAGGCWVSDGLQRLGLSAVAVDLSHDLLKIGRERLWQFEPAAMEEARHSLEVIGQQWEQALGRLKASLER